MITVFTVRIFLYLWGWIVCWNVCACFYYT